MDFSDEDDDWDQAGPIVLGDDSDRDAEDAAAPGAAGQGASALLQERQQGGQVADASSHAIDGADETGNDEDGSSSAPRETEGKSSWV